MAQRGLILLLGADGFIGRHLCAAMQARGWKVRSVVSTNSHRDVKGQSIQLDINYAIEPAAWHDALIGVCAVVNAAGILRETKRASFERIHNAAPTALATACLNGEVNRFVQISVLGNPHDGEFIASKHRFDQFLQSSSLPSTILRPSVVYSAHGSYGGSSLLRALAVLPWFMPLPDSGAQKVQPLDVHDLAELVCDCLEHPAINKQPIEVGGPELMTLAEYLAQWRAWLGFSPAKILSVPAWSITPAIWLADHFAKGPMGSTMWKMLQRGNSFTASSESGVSSQVALTTTLSNALQKNPAHVQDRWHAQLYFLAPILSTALALVWLVSGAVGITATAVQIYASVADSTLLQAAHPVLLARFMGGIDILLGAMLLLRIAPVRVLQAMFFITLFYTLTLGMLAPQLWLEPTGGLLKNIVLLPATLLALILLNKK